MSDYTSLPIIGVYILGLPLVMAVVAFAFEGFRMHRRANLDDAVGFWGYWWLCVREAYSHWWSPDILIQGLAGFALAFIGVIAWDRTAAVLASSTLVVGFVVAMMRTAASLHEQQRADRIRLRDKQVNSLDRLQNMRDEIAAMRAGVSQERGERGLKRNKSIAVNAGQLLMDSMMHGTMSKACYTSVAARLGAAYSGQFDIRLGGDVVTGAAAAFHHFTTWSGQHDKKNRPTHVHVPEGFEFGLDKIATLFDERIAELKAKTRELTDTSGLSEPSR